jgi:hypothetical protein
MWIPRTLEELRVGMANNAHESASLEFKRELPAGGKSRDIAVDVAAMAADGGTIIYGVAEDKASRGLNEAPIALAGTVERVTSVVQMSVREVPAYEAFAVETNPDQGFLIVVVPPSPRAPHMVEVKGEWRFYGRGPGGNVPLTEAQVFRLYERRARDQEAAAALVDSIVLSAPGLSGLEVHFHLVFRPVLSDSSLRERWIAADKASLQIRDAINAVVSSLQFKRPWQPTLQVAAIGEFRYVVDGLSLQGDGVSLTVGDDGTVRLFVRHAADVRPGLDGANSLFLRDGVVSQCAAQAALLDGELCKTGGYVGPVLGAAYIVGAGAARSSNLLQPELAVPLGSRIVPPVPDPYKRTGRWPASVLAADPVRVARELVGPFLQTMRQGHGGDLFTT